jgi:hypothetical protein
VVFKENPSARYASSLGQQNIRIISVVQHIHEHDNVHALVGIRNMLSVETSRGDSRIRSSENVDAFHATVLPDLGQPLGEQSVPAPYVKD